MRNLVVLLGFILAGGCSAAELKPDARLRAELKLDLHVSRSDSNTDATDCRGWMELRQDYEELVENYPLSHEVGAIKAECATVQVSPHAPVAYPIGAVQVIINNAADVDCRILRTETPFDMAQRKYGNLTIWLECG